MAEAGWFLPKPETVFAVRWDGSAEDAAAVIEWVLAHDGVARYHEAVNHETRYARQFLTVEFLATDKIRMEPNAWLVLGPRGCVRVLDSATFEATFEATVAV